MFPTPGDVHLNRLLSNVLHAYSSEPGDFVAGIAAPSIPVEAKSDNYAVYAKEDWFRVDVTKERGLSAEADSGGWTVDLTNSYVCKVYAFKHLIDDQTRANQSNPVNIETAATKYVSDQLLRKREVDWMNTFFSTGIWAGAADQTGVAAAPSTNQFLQFNDANSTPVEVIDAQAVAIKEKTGKFPNTLILGMRVWYALKNHPDLIDRIKHVMKGVMTVDLLAQVLGIERVLLAGANRNTAARGQTGVFSFIAGKAMLLCYVNPTPQVIGTPTSMVTFSWTGYTGASELGTRMKKYREDPKNSDALEGEMAYAMKLVGADLGVFFTAVVA